MLLRFKKKKKKYFAIYVLDIIDINFCEFVKPLINFLQVILE